jgi:hypothetical protein
MTWYDSKGVDKDLRRYHPTTNGQLKYERDALVGHGNRYISIHPYFFKAAFLDPRTHHFLRNIMEAYNFHEVLMIFLPCLGISSWRLTKLLMLFLPHCHPHAAKN